MPKEKKVLCICEANSCRSVLVAALLQKELGHEFQIESAGIGEEARKGLPANIYVERLLHGHGIDVADHKSRWLGDLDLTQFSRIVCVDEEIELEVLAFLAGYRIEVLSFSGMPNPYKKNWDAYRACLAFLDAEIPKIATQIRA